MMTGRLHRYTTERNNDRYCASVFGPLTDLVEYDNFEIVAGESDTTDPTNGEASEDPGDTRMSPSVVKEEKSRQDQSESESAEAISEEEVYIPEPRNALASPDRSNKPVAVKKLDFMIGANSFNHNTTLYEQTHPRKDQVQQLIVRRGQKFTVKLTLGRKLLPDRDDITFNFETGDEPLVSKGTSIVLPIKPLAKRKWGVYQASEKGNTYKLEIQTPPDCSIGKWRLSINSSVKGAKSSPAIPSSASLPPGAPARPKPATMKKVLRYIHPHPIYVLFNPWSKDDQVWMEDEVERDEAVLNDRGKIYNGNSRQLFGRPWIFGQFKPHVLDCALHLLDLSCLRPGSIRGSVVHVTRALSAICNQQDDNGVLVGNWSGKYDDGTKPTKWTGSAPILKQFYDTKEPVKYGQCWVFSGVTTTVCRALGIPCRSVTNFSSAHDCDGSMTIDSHWDCDGTPMDYLNHDSVWNFHVWNEAWMARPDLQAGFGGWQAFDATPQETSEGLYRAGPASVIAVKQGIVNMPYDTPFIFAEVNADRVQWMKQENGEWVTKLTKSTVGKRISTHRPRTAPKKPNPLDYVDQDYGFKEDDDRLDITDQYKYPEGTEDERAAVYRAATWSTKPIVYDLGPDDVRFEFVPKDDLFVGSSFDVTLKVQNKSRLERKVNVTLTLTSIYYTGVPKAVVKTGKFEALLGPIRAEDMVMRVLPEEYIHHIVDQVSFKVAVLGKVEETGQVFANSFDFRLRRPDPFIEAPFHVKVGQEFNCHILFANTMPVHLTQCSWLIEGPGIESALDIDHPTMDPFERCEIDVAMTATELGPQQIVCSFNTKELNDLMGSHTVMVDRDPNYILEEVAEDDDDEGSGQGTPEYRSDGEDGNVGREIYM